MMRPALLALMLISAAPTGAAEVVESLFEVTYRHNGADLVRTEPVVPLLPDNACYAWHMRANAPLAEVTYVERFVLPAGIDWGEQAPETVIEPGGAVGVTTRTVQTDGEGRFSHGWCVAEGDPTGPHRIEVTVDGVLVATYRFEVVAPEAYDFPPARIPERALRSADGFW